MHIIASKSYASPVIITPDKEIQGGTLPPSPPSQKEACFLTSLMWALRYTTAAPTILSAFFQLQLSNLVVTFDHMHGVD